MAALTGAGIYREPPPVRDEVHKKFVRSLPCSVPGCRATYIEASHCGSHGLRQKASDSKVIPLCIRHHRSGNDALDKIGRLRFEEIHGISVDQIIRRLTERPKIRIEAGFYVAKIHGEDFWLRPLHDGNRAAVKLARTIFYESVRNSLQEAQSVLADFTAPSSERTACSPSRPSSSVR